MANLHQSNFVTPTKPVLSNQGPVMRQLPKKNQTIAGAIVMSEDDQKPELLVRNYSILTTKVSMV